MAESRQFENAIKVVSIRAEYRRVALTPCPNCADRLEIRKQTLVNDVDTGKHYDLVEARCVQCGRAHEFLFDINSFFAEPHSER